MKGKGKRGICERGCGGGDVESAETDSMVPDYYLQSQHEISVALHVDKKISHL